MDSLEREKMSRKFANAERNLNKLQQSTDLPYLLLDIRTKDDYDTCHIITALNYPTAMLARTMNNEIPELLAYKNQPGKIIAVYDEDEKLAGRAAQTLCERGYDNLFLLSGGLKLAFKKFPEGLICGDIPAHLGLATGRSGTSRSQMKSSMSSASSTYSNISKKTFDRYDVEKLNEFLDADLLGRNPNSRLTGRKSHSCAGSQAGGPPLSSAASVSSVRTLTSIHEKPWKPSGYI
jgi:centrosomal protein CEP41